MRQATRAPEERPPRRSGSVDAACSRSCSTTAVQASSRRGAVGGERRPGDAVGLLDQRHGEAGVARRRGDGLEVGGVDRAAGAVAEDEGADGLGLGGMDVRPGEALRGLELEHGGRGGGHRAHARTAWDDAGVDEAGAPVRVDKWLWAARLVKTRALAAEAVKGGRVHVNGQAVKPSRDVRPGDELELTVGTVRRTVVVRGTAERRGPAKEAERLYEETAGQRGGARARGGRAAPAAAGGRRPRPAADEARPAAAGEDHGRAPPEPLSGRRGQGRRRDRAPLPSAPESGSAVDGRAQRRLGLHELGAHLGERLRLVREAGEVLRGRRPRPSRASARRCPRARGACGRTAGRASPGGCSASRRVLTSSRPSAMRASFCSAARVPPPAGAAVSSVVSRVSGAVAAL